MKLKALSLLVFASLSIRAQSWIASSDVVPIANDPTSGTTLNALAKLTSNGQAITTTTSDKSGIIGIVAQNAGTSGYAGIVAIGEAACAFDGGTTAGDYVQASATVPGSCHDAGASFPTSGTVVGRVLSTNTLAGTFNVFVFPAEIDGSALSAGGVYSLPAATSTILGGVTVGPYSGLTINGSGALSVVYGHTAYTALEGNDPLIAGALQDPGANGLLKRTSQSTTGIASASDLPTGYPYSELSGTPSLFNQIAEAGGTAVTQRSKINFVGGANVSVTPTDNGTDTTTFTIASTAPPEVSSVTVGTLPSWLTGSFANSTSTPSLAIGAASGQTSHQVIGTCGAGTTFGPCALVVSDLPTGYPYSDLAGAPSLFDQQLQVNGAAVTQRPTVNFVAGPNVSLTPTDNGTDTTTITVNSSAAGVTNIDPPTVPSWLAASVQNSATIPVITLAPATGQTPHQVLGTCGTATSFGPCQLTVGDLPTGYAYSNLSGAPTFGSAAYVATSAFDSAGAAANAQTNAETFSANANNINSGTVDYSHLPVGTTPGSIAAANDPRFLDATSLNGTSISGFSGLPWFNAGSPITATSSNIISLFNVPQGTSSPCYLRSDGSCATPATNAGTVTTFETPNVPSWFTASVNFANTTPTLTILPASGQTPHQVIGTCGSATTFGPCALQLSDLPTGYAYANLSGLPVLNSAASQPISAFDSAGAATNALTSAETYSSNASNLETGTVAYGRLPIGTTPGTIAAANDARFLNATSLNGTPISAFYGIPLFTNGTPAPATAGAIVGLFNSGACTGYLKSDGTCGNPTATGTGTVTNLLTPAVPNWLIATVTNGSTTPYLTIAAAGSQNPHQVLGTCGAATTFGPCSLTISDLPTGYAYSNLSGSPTLGSAAAQNISAFDGAGAATAALNSAEAFSSNAANLNSGTVPYTRLPVGTGASQVAAANDSRFITTASQVIALFNGGTCSGFLKSDGTCNNTVGSGNGSVTAEQTPIVPTWLTASVATATTTPQITLAPASSQTSHQVIGTCGTATAFGPCNLTMADLPAATVGQPAYSQSFTNQVSVTLTHDYGTLNVITQCFDSSNTLITPGSVIVTDINDVTVNFLDVQTGRCVVNGEVGPTGAAGSGSGSTSFNAITTGTNTAGLLVAGTLAPSGSGTITANQFSGTLTNAAVPAPTSAGLGGIKSGSCPTGQAATGYDTTGTVICATVASSAPTITHAFGGTFTAGGAALSTGAVLYGTIPYACTINGFNTNVDQGAVAFDVWKVATGTTEPTIANSIVGSAYPGLASGTARQSNAIPGWATAVSANDVYAIQLRTVGGGTTYASLAVTCQ